MNIKGLLNGGYWKTRAAAQSSSTNPTNQGITNGATRNPNPYPVATIDPSPRDPLTTCTTFGEIIGWRMWFMVRGYLRSIRRDKTVIWAPGEDMTGNPTDYNKEGVYAWKLKRDGLEQALRYADEYLIIIGRVALWGTVIEHELGYRAEFGKIISIDYADCASDTPYPTAEKNVAMVDRLQKLYLLKEF